MNQQTDSTVFKEQLRNVIPLLQDMPSSILEEIDPCEFAYPIPEVEVIRAGLEKQTGHYVMTYKTGVFFPDIPARAHLCNWVKGAPLSPENQLLLKESEEASAPFGVSFVIYQRPLEIVPPSGNPIAQAYLQRQQKKAADASQ
jgi:hypothetical protein